MSNVITKFGTHLAAVPRLRLVSLFLLSLPAFVAGASFGDVGSADRADALDRARRSLGPSVIRAAYAEFNYTEVSRFGTKTGAGRLWFAADGRVRLDRKATGQPQWISIADDGNRSVLWSDAANQVGRATEQHPAARKAFHLQGLVYSAALFLAQPASLTYAAAGGGQRYSVTDASGNVAFLSIRGERVHDLRYRRQPPALMRLDHKGTLDATSLPPQDVVVIPSEYRNEAGWLLARRLTIHYDDTETFTLDLTKVDTNVQTAPTVFSPPSRSP